MTVKSGKHLNRAGIVGGKPRIAQLRSETGI